MNDFEWHQILSGLLNHVHSNSISHEVAELIASGKVHVYQLPSMKSSGAIPSDDKCAYQFFPSIVIQYAPSPYRLERFNSVAKAQAFINGIKWSGSALARVASDLRMDHIVQEKIIKNGSSTLEFGKQEIIKLLSEGKAVVLKVERITASPSKKSAAELVPLRANDKPPILAPETKGSNGNEGKDKQVKKKLEPNTPEHKADRWKKYQEKGGEKSYDEWSKQYDTNMRNYKYGAEQEAKYREFLKADEGTVKTAFTDRQIDILKIEEMYAGQLKTGPVSLTKENIIAIKKDANLVENGWKVEHILEKGASKPYIDALKKAGIDSHIGSKLPK